MNVSYSVQSFLNCSVSVMGAILVVVAVTPGMLAAIFILGIIYYRVQVGCCVLVRQAALQLTCVAACWSFKPAAACLLQWPNCIPEQAAGPGSNPALAADACQHPRRLCTPPSAQSFAPAHRSGWCSARPPLPSTYSVRGPLGGAALLSPTFSAAATLCPCTDALTSMPCSAMQVYYIATSRELKRLDSLALSPIFGNFNESLQGLLTLRAFRKQDQFMQRNHRLLNDSNRVWWPIQVGTHPCSSVCLTGAKAVACGGPYIAGWLV